MTEAQARPQAIGTYEAFVSYSRADQQAVRLLDAALRERGRTLWVDWEGIAPTAEWMVEIREAIDAAEAVIFVLSPTSVQSRVCGEELEHALARKKRIVPVLVADVDAGRLPPELAKRNWVLMRAGDDLQRAADEIASVLDQDLDLVKLHTRLSVRAADWETSGRSSAKLLRGSDLGDAESWLAAPGKGPQPTQEQISLVTTSRQAASRTQRRLVTGVSFGLVLALVLGVLALVQRNSAVDQRNLAQTQALASAALARLGSDPEASLLFALEADKLGRTPLVEQALRSAVLASHVEHVFTPAGPDARMGALTFSHDGTRLFTTATRRGNGFEQTFASYDLKTGQRLVSKPIVAGAYLPVGLAVVHDDELVLARMGLALIDAGTGTSRVPTKAPFNGIDYSVAAAPDGQSFFVATQSGTAMQLAAGTGAPIRTFGSPGKELYDARPSPNGRRLAVTGDDGVVRVYDVASARLQLSFRPGSSTTAARWSPNGRLIATASQDRISRIWDAANGTLIQEFGNDAPGVDIAWATDDYLAIADQSGRARVRSVATGEVLSDLLGHVRAISSITNSPDGQRLATASDDGTVRVWRLGPAVPALGRHAPDTITGADVSPDGTRVVSASYGGGTVLSDAATGQVSKTLGVDAVEAPRFSPDGQSVAALVATGARPGVRLYDAATGRLTWSQLDLGTVHGTTIAGGLQDRPSAPRSAAFSPDGSRRLAVLTDLGCRLLDAATGRVLAVFDGIPAASPYPQVQDFGHTGDVAWDPHDRWVIVPNGRDLALLDPRSLREKDRIAGPATDLRDLALAPDGSRVVATFYDGSARIWQLPGKKLERTLDLTSIGHGVAVNAEGFIATTANDGNLRVWAPDGSERMRVRVASVQAMTVRWLPDGRRLLVGVGEGHDERSGFGSAGGLHVWGAAVVVDCEVCRGTDDLVRFARSRVTRQLLPAERRSALEGTASGNEPQAASPTPTPSTGPSAPLSSDLVGTYDSAAVPKNPYIPGPFPASYLRIFPDGTFVRWQDGGYGYGQMVDSGGVLTVTDVGCDGVGRFRWSRSGTRLTFVPLNALCQREALAIPSWVRR